VLSDYLAEKCESGEILLMTHIVLGYPSFEASLRIVDAMVAAGVELMELQIPFSEPIADGPVILGANQQALARGATVEQCFALAREVTRRHPIPFLFMSYYNPIFRRGVGRFVDEAARSGIEGMIVPDLPPEEAGEYLGAMQAQKLAPIFVFSPTTPDHRLAEIAGCARGFVYCVARKGVTGSRTEFSSELDAYLARCRAATSLPLALGFGVKSREDVDALRGKVEIAVVGSETLRVIDTAGIDAVGPFVRGLRGGARGGG
jgi:tryptophan synthase alpha chain